VLLADIRHSAWANRSLLDGCSALTSDELERELRISHSSILATLRHIYDGERVWLDCLRTTPDLGTWRVLPGEVEQRFPRWRILRHVLEHSTLHRGQVVGMIRMLGHQPPANTQWITILRVNQAFDASTVAKSNVPTRFALVRGWRELPRLEAVVVSLGHDLAVAKFNKHCGMGTHLGPCQSVPKGMASLPVHTTSRTTVLPFVTSLRIW
jgi:uncharacterized damage-inducible protein DinB